MPADQSRTANPAPRTRNSAKRAINLSLSAEVLKINVSQVRDSHPQGAARREQERRWREEHADFIAAYNAAIEAEGPPLDAWRTF